MKRAHWLYVAAISLMTTPVFAAMTGSINGFLGQKTLDSGDWEPLDQQVEIGAMLDIRGTNWPVSIAVDLLGSSDDATINGVDVTGTTAEFNIGARKVFDLTGSQLHPYVGGGLALIAAEIEGASGGVKVSDDDTGTGYWVGGGAYWRFANNINLGMDVRYSNAEVDLFGITGEAGGTHAGLLVGYHW